MIVIRLGPGVAGPCLLLGFSPSSSWRGLMSFVHAVIGRGEVISFAFYSAWEFLLKDTNNQDGVSSRFRRIRQSVNNVCLDCVDGAAFYVVYST